jgi:hypothetical protein
LDFSRVFFWETLLKRDASLDTFMALPLERIILQKDHSSLAVLLIKNRFIFATSAMLFFKEKYLGFQGAIICLLNY